MNVAVYPGSFDPIDIRDLAASFQAAVGDVMVEPRQARAPQPVEAPDELEHAELARRAQPCGASAGPASGPRRSRCGAA